MKPHGPPTTLVVSWTVDNARSRDLAAALRADLLLMPWASPRQSAARRVQSWLRSAARTRHAVRTLPAGSLVVVMCPPVFAPLVAVRAARRSGCRVVVDAHSGTWNDGNWTWSHGLIARVLRRADLLVVTDPTVAALSGIPTDPVRDDRQRREALGRRAVPFLPLHDPVPHRERHRHQPREMPLVVFPASGAPDEPLTELAAAAELLRGEVHVAVTGSVRRDLAGSALVLTGHLPQEEYERLLDHVDLVLALTDREATMQRSAYEAVARSLPLVCSDTSLLRTSFAGAAVFVAHTPEAIAAGVRTALTERVRLEAGSDAVRVRLADDQQQGLALLGLLVGAAP